MARITPTRTNGFQKVNSTMYMQSLCRREGEQVREVSRASSRKVQNVKAQADKVPLGSGIIASQQ